MRKRTANRLIRAAMEAIREIRGEQKPVQVNQHRRCTQDADGEADPSEAA
jgi:hypothetical protein